MSKLLQAAAIVWMLSASWWIVHTIRHPRITSFEDQYEVILHRSDLVPRGGVLVIGDSITAANYFPTLCGKPALNAGISWSTSHDWAPRAAELVRRAQPSVVILALGNNDARPDWHDDYRKLARYAFFAVTPKQPEKAAFIRTLVSTVPVPDQTYDGTHLTTVGAREWVRRIDTKCAMLSAQQTDKAKMLGTSGAK